MKIKYLRLSREEKKLVKQNFYKTNAGKNVKKHLTNALVCSIFCIGISIYIIVDAFIQNVSFWNKIYGFFILGFGIAGIVAYHKIFFKKINEYVIKSK